ncbi:MAG: hypothetical protein M3250_04345, partial [Thermoproteota archaeon]|nr:hypothetical protein [Thermoproteota archaeon]
IYFFFSCYFKFISSSERDSTGKDYSNGSASKGKEGSCRYGKGFDYIALTSGLEADLIVFNFYGDIAVDI